MRRLVLVSSVCRLGSAGRRVQRALATRLAEGDLRGPAWRCSLCWVAAPVAREVWAVMGWLLGPVMFRGGVPDVCATIEAEDVFDLTDRLPDVHVPTLVVGGDRDGPYGPAVFWETARGLRNGRLLLCEGTGHVGVQSKRRFVREIPEFLGSGTGQRMAGSTQGTEGGQP